MRRNTDMRTSPQTLATVALGIAVGVLAAAAAFPDRPARVGSVDIERIFTSLDEQKSSEASIKELGEKMAGEKDKLSRALQDLNGELESYKPGTPPYNETLKKGTLTEGTWRPCNHARRIMSALPLSTSGPGMSNHALRSSGTSSPPISAVMTSPMSTGQVVDRVHDGSSITGSRRERSRTICHEALPAPMIIEARSSSAGTVPPRKTSPTSRRLRKCTEGAPCGATPPR